jgi:hypothetical protein
LKARILLKAGVSEAGEEGSDNAIIEARDEPIDDRSGPRKQLVEESLEAALKRMQRATPAIPRIFDGEKRSSVNRPGVLAASQRSCALDATVAQEQSRRARHRRSRQR